MTGDDRRQAIFGGFDGMTSALAVITAAVTAGQARGALLVTAIGVAIAAGVGMGGGEYLSDTSEGGQLRRAVVMTVATLAGALAPIVPYAVLGPGVPAALIAGAIALAVGALIAHVRGGTRRAYVVTYGMLLVVGGLTILESALIGGGG